MRLITIFTILGILTLAACSQSLPAETTAPVACAAELENVTDATRTFEHLEIGIHASIYRADRLMAKRYLAEAKVCEAQVVITSGQRTALLLSYRNTFKF